MDRQPLDQATQRMSMFAGYASGHLHCLHYRIEERPHNYRATTYKLDTLHEKANFNNSIL